MTVGRPLDSMTTYCAGLIRPIVSAIAAARAIMWRRKLVGRTTIAILRLRRVLLCVNAPVVRHQNIEAPLFGEHQKLSVIRLLPMVRVWRREKARSFKLSGEMSRHALIEEHALSHESAL